MVALYVFFFQAEDGIRDYCLSRGLGDVCKRQSLPWLKALEGVSVVFVSPRSYKFPAFRSTAVILNASEQKHGSTRDGNLSLGIKARQHERRKPFHSDYFAKFELYSSEGHFNAGANTLSAD